MMSSLWFLTVHLLGGSLLLLTAVCEAQYYSNVTPPPDYESDYNSTFEYSFFSNSSSEDLEWFIGEVDGEEEEEEEEEVSVTSTTISSKSTERSEDTTENNASIPVSLELRKLLWTSVILMVLNLQQL
ncbi:uncharacterized protein si:ch211-191i18.2 [Girardinichthys multiradiatus]|uniref:uncharacterized protein si:ch211-191i18.2 n=1 Tax=Girardinichthys multiradiatus TaxID=208333 RepID=UPI001FAC1F55|nr:uncharacterized protein si:ch211-191i18.2 [Girardinichthys multiradiatus]